MYISNEKFIMKLLMLTTPVTYIYNFQLYCYPSYLQILHITLTLLYYRSPYHAILFLY